jgi:hypothetical protein
MTPCQFVTEKHCDAVRALQVASGNASANRRVGLSMFVPESGSQTGGTEWPALGDITGHGPDSGFGWSGAGNGTATTGGGGGAVVVGASCGAGAVSFGGICPGTV